MGSEDGGRILPDRRLCFFRGIGFLLRRDDALCVFVTMTLENPLF
jgi:hypothetical protein